MLFVCWNYHLRLNFRIRGEKREKASRDLYISFKFLNQMHLVCRRGQKTLLMVSQNSLFWSSKMKNNSDLFLALNCNRILNTILNYC